MNNACEKLRTHIKDILDGCKNKTYDFTIVIGTCTDCSHYPDLIVDGGDVASISHIKLGENNIITLYGRTMYEDIELQLEDLSEDGLVLILDAMITGIDKREN